MSSYVDQSNGANGAYYKLLAEGFEGVSSASVSASGDEVVVYVAANGQSAVPVATKAALQAELTARREPCTTVTVNDAVAVAVNVAVSIEPVGDFSTAKTLLEQRIRNLLDGFAIGRRITLAQLGQLVMDSGLAENYRFAAPGTDVNASDVQVLRAGVITVSRMEG